MMLESIPPSLLLALICSHGAAFLVGTFSALMMSERNKMNRQIEEYQREREKELRQKVKNSWGHPTC